MGWETERGQGCNLSEEELPFTEGEGGKEAGRNWWREQFPSSGSERK